MWCNVRFSGLGAKKVEVTYMELQAQVLGSLGCQEGDCKIPLNSSKGMRENKRSGREESDR